MTAKRTMKGVFDLRLRVFVAEDGEMDFAIERMTEGGQGGGKSGLPAKLREAASDRLEGRVYNFIEGARGPVSKSQILRRFRGVRAAEINVMLARLVETGRVALCVVGTTGRPVTGFSAVEPGLVAIFEKGE